MSSLETLHRVWRELREDPETPLLRTALCSAYYHARGANLYAHPNTTIRGLRNIRIDGRLKIGLRQAGFLCAEDHSYLNVADGSTLRIEGNVNLGRGCRVATAAGGEITLRDCAVNGRSRLIIAHGLEIGPQTTVSWDCEFLDEDWHEIRRPGGRMCPDKRIVIGPRVWIGAHAWIGKGVRLEEGTVVAAHSVVTRSFGPNVLIGGSPARVLATDVEWS